MSDNKPTTSIDAAIATTCGVCGQTECGHSTTTSDILSDQVREKRRPKTEEIPVELSEFAASYDVQGLVGEGGMSAVYRARHKALNKPMAIKMLHAHLLRDPVQLKRFQQEAQALFMLQHENIVTVREFGSTKTGKPYLVMDFLEGTSLSEMIRSQGPVPVHRALKIFIQVCDALEHAHSKQIIHRDIKPSNIVLCEGADGTDSVRIVDFGIAKFSCDDINPGLTQTGDVFGSPLYMSPEQCLGHKLDARTDMYAFGCVMYEMLSGKPPLIGDTALSTIHKHTTEMPQPLVVPNCDSRLRQRLDEIIFKTLEKDPEKRYQSMAALKKDLEELAADTGFKSKTGHYVKYARLNRRVVNTVRKHPLHWLAGFAIVAAISSLLTYTMLEHSRPVLEPPQALNATIDWNWLARPVEPIPLGFNDKLRVAWLLVDDAKARLGTLDPSVQHKVRSMADKMIKYGMWDHAIRYLNDVRAGYPAGDPNVADTDQTIGDMYVQKKDWPDAARAYGKAFEAYKADFNTADNSEWVTRLKYAWVLLRDGKVAIAKSHIKEVLDNKWDTKKFEHNFALAGRGDCDLFLLSKGALEAPAARAQLATEAIGDYSVALQHLPAYSVHDAQLCRLRMADVYILQGDYRQACDLYGEVVNHLDVFSDAEAGLIQRNYARLLARNFNFVAAAHAEDAAKEADRRAAKVVKQQDTYDPTDQY